MLVKNRPSRRWLFHKMEQIKDYLLEEEFIQNQERLKNEETREEKNDSEAMNLIILHKSVLLLTRNHYTLSQHMFNFPNTCLIFPIHV
jgi:hypothetical protein